MLSFQKIGLIFSILSIAPLLNGAELAYNNSFGGARADIANAVAADRDGNVYVAGSTTSLNFPVSGGVQQRLGGNLPAVSNDGGKTWSAGAIDTAILSVIQVGDTLYAGTSNGVYRCDLSGQTWLRISSEVNYGVNALWADPRTPERLVAASDHGILISSDAGVTWVESNDGLPSTEPVNRISVRAIASPPGRPDILFAVTPVISTVFRSLDSGKTWSPLPIAAALMSVVTVVADPADPNVVYAGTASLSIFASSPGIYVTSDGGNSWRHAASLELSSGAQTIAASQGSLYAATKGGVVRSTDGGKTWSSAGLTGKSVGALAVEPDNWLRAWAVAAGGIYRTFDGGSHWSRLGPAIPIGSQSITVSAQMVLAAGEPGSDAYVIKWDPAGLHALFSTYLGGSGNDYAVGISLDADGNIWVAGETSSPDFPVTNDSKLTGEQNAFVAKLSPDGSTILYASYFGGSAWESVTGLAVDANGAAYIVGYTESQDFPATAGAAQTEYGSGRPDPLSNGASTSATAGDGFVAKFGRDGALAYATYLGGTSKDAAVGIAVDASGNAYAVGFTKSLDFPVTENAAQTQYAGGTYDGFIAKLDPDGHELTYSSLLGTSGTDSLSAVAVDSAGAAYVTGNSRLFFGNQQFSCSSHAVGTCRYVPPPTDSGAFVAKLKPDGSEVETGRAVGNDCRTRSASLVLDHDGNIWVGGTTAGSFAKLSPVQTLALGDGFLAEFEPAELAALFSSLVDGASGVAVDPEGSVYAAGWTTRGDVPKQLLGGQVRPSAAVVLKIDPSKTFPIRLDDVTRFGQTPWPGFFESSYGAAPGQILTLTGDRLGPVETVSAQPDESGAYPVSLSGVQVSIDGKPATILTAGEKEIRCIVPFAAAGHEQSSVQVSYNGSVSNTVAFAIRPVSLKVLAMVNPDGTVNDYSHPAPAGSYVIIYVSGMGLTEPAGPDSQTVPGPGTMLAPLTATTLTDTGEEVSLEVLYAGPAPGLVAGVGQINLALPASLEPGPQAVQLSAAGQAQESVTVYIK